MAATKSKTRRTIAETLEPRRLFAAPGLNWPLQFDDEFNGTSVDYTKWSNYLPWTNTISGDNRYHATNDAYASYMEPSDVTESGGSIQLSTSQGNFYSTNGTWFGYSEMMLTTNATFWYQYGYAEIRAELPTGPGNWPAFWSLSNGWPPENDIMEAGPGAGINHQGIYNMASTWQSVDPAVFPANTWHTYGLEWGPGYEKFYEDGNVTLSVTANIPAEGMYFLLNSGVATAADSNYSNSNDNTLSVDYMRVYGYNASPGPNIGNGGMEASNSGFTAAMYGGASVSTTNPRTGYDDLQIAGYGGSQPTVTGLSPNTTYTFSAYGYSNTAGSYGLIGVKGYGGTEINTPFAQTSWGQDAETFTTGSTNTSAVLYLYNQTSATTYYDDASLELTPVISPIANVEATSAAPATVPISVTQGGSGTNFTITATSSNQTLLPNSGLTIGGTPSAPTITVKPAAGQIGTATVTLSLVDLFGGTATASFLVTDLTPVTITGPAVNDIFRLVRNGANLALYENNTGSSPNAQYTYASTGLFTINGQTGNDQLILDYSGGDPVPPGGIAFNGSTGTNTLAIANSSGGVSATLSNGSLAIGSDSISFTNTQNLNLDLGAGSNTLLSTTPVLSSSTLDLTVDSGSTLTLAASSTLPTNAVINLAGTGILKSGSQSESIDQLTGTGSLNMGTGTLTIGANNGTSTFNGSIIGTGGLTKYGTGTFVLAGSDSFTGPVNLGGGATTGGNVDGNLQITSAAALAGVTQVNFDDNNSAYAALQLNSSTGMTLPSTLSFLLDANTAGASGTAATLIDSIAGNNKIAGAMSFTVGGAGYGISVDSGSLTFTGSQSATSHALYLRGAGTGSFTAGLTGTASLVEQGPGSWTLNGINSYSGYTNVSGGTLNVSSGASLASTNINSLAGGTLNVLGTIPATATVTANGTVNFGPAVTSALLVRKLASLSIGSAGVATVAYAINHQYRTLLVPSTLTFTANTGMLDLSNNDLDVPGASLATLNALVGSGYQSGTWTGTGITSSAAAVDSTHLTALGIMTNNAGGTPLYGSGDMLGTFDGTSPGTNDVLVKFTFYGDANLDGKVDGSDYSRIDSGSLTAATGWSNGDFNYDSNIDGSDYTLLDNAFNTQGSDLSTSAEIATPSKKLAASAFVPQTWIAPAASPFASVASVALSDDDQSILVDRLHSGARLLF